MTRSLRLERPQLLTDLAMERIREAIVRGDFKLGELVSEAQIAQRLGTSKTPVREALVRLKIEGLVDVHPQRGTEVFRLSPEDVGRLCRFRSMLELAALREAATQNRAKLLEALGALLKDLAVAEKKGDVDALAAIDMDFHHQFFVCCDNDYLRGAYALIRYQLLALRHRSPIEQCVESHQVLYNAIERNDVDGACELLAEHVGNTEERYCTACQVG